MLTDDDWAEIWKEFHKWWHDAHPIMEHSWRGHQIPKIQELVNAKLRAKAEAMRKGFAEAARTGRGDVYRCLWCEQLTYLPDRPAEEPSK